MNRTRIKVCGLTRAADIQAAVDAGVDALGMVFYPRSRRCLSLAQASALRAQVPAFVSLVALFVNPTAAEVESVVRAIDPDLLQFHGDESPDFCAQFGARHLKAFRVGAPGQDTAAALAARCQQYSRAAGWLFDSYSAGFGGSGRSFDDRLLARIDRGPAAPPMILSGGLNAETVAARIAALHPFAVDVSSGVEQSPGCKDTDRIRAFVRAVRIGDEDGR